MKKDSPSFLKCLGLMTAIHVLALAFFFVFGIVAAGVVALGGHYVKAESLRFVAGILILAGLLLSWPVAKRIVMLMFEHESMTFWQASVHAWYHYVMLLSFLPVIGPAMQRMVGSRQVATRPESSEAAAGIPSQKPEL